MPNYIILLPDIHFKTDTIITMLNKKRKNDKRLPCDHMRAFLRRHVWGSLFVRNSA